MAYINTNSQITNEKSSFLEHIKRSRRNTPADFASIDTNVNFDDDSFIEEIGSDVEGKDNISFIFERKDKRDSTVITSQSQQNGPNVNIKIAKKKPFYTLEERSSFSKQLKFKEKTELCKNWVLYNDCFYKETCSFAHGEKELRHKKNLQLYKTKQCKSFLQKGFCNYGNRCQYLHIISEKRVLKYKYLINKICYNISSELSKFNNDSQNVIQILKYINSKNAYIIPRLDVFERLIK